MSCCADASAVNTTIYIRGMCCFCIASIIVDYVKSFTHLKKKEKLTPVLLQYLPCCNPFFAIITLRLTFPQLFSSCPTPLPLSPTILFLSHTSTPLPYHSHPSTPLPLSPLPYHSHPSTPLPLSPLPYHSHPSTPLPYHSLPVPPFSPTIPTPLSLSPTIPTPLSLSPTIPTPLPLSPTILFLYPW